MFRLCTCLFSSVVGGKICHRQQHLFSFNFWPLTVVCHYQLQKPLWQAITPLQKKKSLLSISIMNTNKVLSSLDTNLLHHQYCCFVTTNLFLLCIRIKCVFLHKSLSTSMSLFSDIQLIFISIINTNKVCYSLEIQIFFYINTSNWR